MAERMTRYQLAFAPFLNKYINDELSKHYGGRRVTGVLPGLQNQCGTWYVPGGFDSHMSPPKERKKNMGMNQTPVSERVHIGFFGKRNAGKSSVMNAVTGQDLAVVSDVKGTTTDPVYKTMELLPLGPVVMMDTPGIDDEGELGELRVKKSYQVLNKTDIAVVVIDGTCGVSEEDLKITERIQKKNIPYIIVLGTAIAGMNVMLVLIIGILTSGIIGIATGSFGVFDWFGAMGTGITGMGELIIITLLAGGMLETIRYNGGIDFIIKKLTRHVNSKRGAELSIAALVSIANLCTANNTIAIITTGPIAKDIAKRFHLDRRKTASILDTFSCLIQGIIPYGAQMLIAAGLANISPISIIGNLYYPFTMGVCALLAILFRYPRRYS